MAFETKLAAVPSQSLTADGTSAGLITVADTTLFKVRQQVSLSATGQPTLDLEIKAILTLTTFIVGPRDRNASSVADVSAYTVAAAASVLAPSQNRPLIAEQNVTVATYDEEPTVAQRSVLVDQMGNKYTTKNPFPVRLSDGSINVQTLNAELNVQLSAKDNDPVAGDVHSSVRIGGTDGSSEMVVNPDGSINVSSYSMIFNFIQNGNLLKLANFDSVIPTVSGTITDLNYYEDGANIARATINFINNINWSIDLSAFVNDDDGSIITDDDGTDLILE